MSMSAYANKGWLCEKRDQLATIKTLAALSYEVSIMEETRPAWVTDETVRKLRRAYQARHAVLSAKG